MTIRAAELRDANAIGVLLAQLGYPAETDFVERKIEIFSSQGYKLLVCEVDDKVVAFASLHCFDMFHSEKKIGRITALCVDENVRDQGIGGILLKAIETYFTEGHCSYIEVTTNVSRLLTPGFYLKHGYVENSRRFVKSIASPR